VWLGEEKDLTDQNVGLDLVNSRFDRDILPSASEVVFTDKDMG
jgi:hypothetical protein